MKAFGVSMGRSLAGSLRLCQIFDIDHGIGLSKVYKDTDEMFRDLGV